MALPDQLADLERKVSVRFSAALAEIRQEMRRAVEAQAQRASSAMISDLDAIRPPADDRLLVEEDLLEMSREAGGEARRGLARALSQAVIEFDRARSQSAVLDALLVAARPFGDHVAVWLLRPTEIVGWASRGFAGDPPRDPIAGCTLSHQASPALARLAAGRGCVLADASEAAQIASALEVAAPARALFLPLVLRDRVAAALYVDAADTGEFEIEALQLLALAAAQRLELQALSTRSYTPTLFFDTDAPADEGGLALWDPATPASLATAAGEEATPATPPVELDASEAIAAVGPSESPAGPEDFWGEAPAEVVEELPAKEPEAAEFELSAPQPESAATVTSPLKAAGDEFAWQLEDAADTARISAETAAAAAIELPDLTPPAASDWTPATEVAESPLAPPAAEPAVEWQEVEDATAPHATYSPAATQRFATPAVTNEFPQPAAAAPADPGISPVSTASTIAFVPPQAVSESDIADDATIRIQRSALYPTAPLVASTTAPAVAPPVAPPAAPLVAPPAEPAFAPARPASPSVQVPDDEPTISRGPRTTEVAPPADLQGPGWAFSNARTARASGDNALHEEARRLARLLVSEIKLYNEDQVEEGRHNRDIYHRLKDDIDRSRQIYEERVHESVRGTTDYFQQELIRSLAGGDPRALGI